MPQLSSHLAALFGFRTFRPHQEAVVRAVLEGRDTFTVMPTGGGKSLCYQLPAKILPGTCVVVSPLISLMKDQVDTANATGLAAAAFNSTTAPKDRDGIRSALMTDDLDLLYVSPERLRLPEFLNFLKTVRISFFAIDEAHCISEWGHDFRPDYLALSALRETFPATPLAAFTATATERVSRDIIARLALRNPYETRASFNRPNLFYQVTPKEDLETQLLAFLREHEDESGIIYRTTRKDVEKTARLLTARGIRALPYHAGLSDAERTATQEAFRNDRCPVIVATIAFGMGIDKPNVRFVIHGDLPKNLESYYQETGRAGRDGDNARCALFYGRQDIAQLLRFAEGIEDADAREIAKTQVYRMLDFTQKEGCRRKSLLGYFGEELPGENCGGCDICAGETEREDATVDAQKLLSAMVRTDCRFGAGHCISIVMGKETPRIRALGHDALPTFGVGQDRDQNYWRRVMDAIIAQGLAVASDPVLPVPRITVNGWEVLRGQRNVSIIRLAESKTTRSRIRKRDLDQSPLFFLLREERTRIAQEYSVPPYAVFADRSLREMASVMPDTPEAFLAIGGVGRHKLEAFGETFLAVINRYRDENPEAAATADKETASRSPAGKNGKEKPADPGKERAQRGDSLRETERLLDLGFSIEAVAAERGRTAGTILSHMAKLSAGGKVFRTEQFMEQERLDAIQDCFTRAGTFFLMPVVEQSRQHPAFAPDGIGFDEARLARILLRKEESTE
ncbi:ATP-dependent DNA helicase RecQ [uncultured delta proteobacterium]|uniref:DNA helicase RecQ n=1 Tax=uncultured delta proteobacterium TaxID=34034 RepID=A0A212J528_9DELT|nr:ATP-dependent DNA helicase RecQ [uncultured delta proteobacterium]